MMTMKFLRNSENIVVKSFVVRETTDALALAICGRAKDLITKYGGRMLFERKLFDGVYYMTVTIGSPDLMNAWEATLDRKSKMQEVTNSKVLIVYDTEKNVQQLATLRQNIRQKMTNCKGAVLSEERLSDGAHQFLLFFSDETQMQVLEESLMAG